ncbi:MAG TPA: SRPBCC family protein [Microthrixaceae bacterium]|nr:SRPBCC family protein [Microthrixaceae bacterium]
MELTNEFSVDVSIDRAWAVLTDVETIAPCLPGAQLQEIEGEEYRGVVKVKVGPITAQYKGAATFIERDEDARRVVIKGDGRDTRGQGTATAMITAQLTEAGPERTTVAVSTDLTVTGKVAQFGRGVMADVSGKLMDQFAVNLATTVLSPGAQAASAPSEAPEPAAAGAGDASRPAAGDADRTTNGTGGAVPVVRTVDQPEAAPIDLVGTAGGSVAKRVVPVLGVAVLMLLVLRWLRRRG